jgi:hypothetical protein
MRIYSTLVALFVGCLVVSPVLSQTKQLSAIGQQCQLVSQDPTAKWRTIPWQTDLLAAQKLAVETQKPMFIWAMDGHPLGCT